jgi:hypothetical protein
MSILARVRRRLARSPWLYWAGVGGLALVAGISVARAGAGVSAARDRWGEPRTVLVATADIAPGAPLAALTAERELPAPLLPPSAIEQLPVAAVARQDVAAGEVLVTADVGALGAPQSLIPPDWLAVPVAEAVPSGALPGDSVRVASGGITLADVGVVVGTGEAATLVAVPADVAAQVAQAASAADAVLLIEP